MSELTEEEARNMGGGFELDTICHRWMGWPTQHVQEYSTEWAEAGPLFEAMGIDILPTSHTPRKFICQSGIGKDHSVIADSPQLAIARACALLVARGITREDVEGTDG